jgi:hypothetical protein
VSKEEKRVAISTQGWKQFLTARKEMLDAYDTAKQKATIHEVEVYQGKVAEAEFRKWLSNFLPRRYAVTPGYIVSQGLKSDQKAPHFDVIIYDALDAPVLWVEENFDASPPGQSRAIPAEYVLGVLEVKSSLSATSSKSAVNHLIDLSPLAERVDDPAERYKRYLPASFFCGGVFFEMRATEIYSEAAVMNLGEGRVIRGYRGGLLLRAEGQTEPKSATLELHYFPTEMVSGIGQKKYSWLASTWGASKCVGENTHLTVMAMWSESGFARFAFDLVAIMQGTYDAGRVSSFHGFGSSGYDV